MKREINFIHKLKRPYKLLGCDEKKLILAIFMSILVVIASFSYAIVKNDGVPKNKSLIAHKGLLDLESYDNLGDTLIELDGEWEFYKNEFIDVLNIRNDRDNFKNHKDIKEYIKVPGNWNNHISKDGTSEGFGTYRLRVKVPYEGSYGIKTSTIRGAAYIYLNGTLISSMGTPSMAKENFVPLSRYNIGFNKSIEKELDIVIHVANYGYKLGGILKPIKFGTSAAVMKRNNSERTMEAILIAICLIISITFLFIYRRCNKEAYLGFFGLGIAFMALYISTMNHQILNLIIDYDFIGRTRVQIAAIIGIALCFLEFAHNYFKPYTNKKVVKILRFMMLSMVIFVFNNPTKPISFRIEIGQIALSIISIATYNYTIWVMLKAIRDKYRGMEYIVFISINLILYWIFMFAKILFEIDLGSLQAFLVFGTLIGFIFLISNRLYLKYKEATELTEERLEKEFKYFYSQISPHFLYNTLNTIIALTYKDTESTREALNNLSVYFRGKLELHLEKGLIPLDHELDMVIAYLEIERMRYGRKLQVIYDIEDNLVAKIPPLTLQPLVENAVRHGLKPKENMGTIKVIAKMVEVDRITIIIEDNGIGMTPEKQLKLLEGNYKQIGLKNVIEKIEILKGASFKLKSELNKGTSIEIIISGGKVS